jgi:phosphatidylglycerophosphate synthase
LLPKSVREYVDSAYPPDKRLGEKWYPSFYVVRSVALLLTPVFVKLRITPNMATYMSLASVIIAVGLNVSGEFAWAAPALFAALVFDAADGQIARITKKGSDWGITLETIQADLGYLLVVPSVAVGLEFEGLIDPKLVYLAFLGAGSFVLFRRFLSRQVRDVDSNDPLFIRIILSQLKPHSDARTVTPLGAVIYHLQRNVVNQLGLLYPSIMLLAIFKQSWLEYAVLAAGTFYLAAATLITLATLSLGNRFRTG